MSRNPARSTPKLRNRLSEEEWRVYQEGLKSLAADAVRLLARACNALDALQQEVASFSDLCTYETDVSDKQLRVAYKSLKNALEEAEMTKDYGDLVQLFYFEQDDYAALTPLGKFAVGLERVVGSSKDIEKRCNSLMDGYVPAQS